MARRLLRPETLRQRRELGITRLCAHNFAHPVALADLVLAPVPNLRQVLHLLRVLLAEVRRVYDQKTVLLDSRRPLRQNLLAQNIENTRVGKVVAQALIGLFQADRLIQCTSNLGQTHRAPGLDAIDHLLHKPPTRFAKTARKFPRKFVDLLSQFPADLVYHSYRTSLI